MKNIIAVGAGKGGVGKTTVAVNLAVALATRGSRVALLDADMYGPNVPIMLGLRTQLETDGKKIVPAERYGLQVVSMGFLTEDDAPVIWRGPMLHGAIQQFFRDVRWNDIDYLIVDMPPGTGDVALSLSQTVPVAGAVLVTTPQTVSLADTRRAVLMYRKLNIPTLGLDREHEPLRLPRVRHGKRHLRQGRRRSAGGRSVGAVPRKHSALRTRSSRRRHRRADRHRFDPSPRRAKALFALAERVAQQVSIASYARRAIPLTPGELSMNVPFTKQTLGNGLDVIVHEDHRVPLVAVSVWYHVGSKNERPGRTGLAHLFEHLMFEGLGASAAGLFRAAAGSRRVAERIDQHRSHQLLGARADRARCAWRCGWKPIAWAGCCRR